MTWEDRMVASRQGARGIRDLAGVPWAAWDKGSWPTTHVSSHTSEWIPSTDGGLPHATKPGKIVM